MIQFMSIVGDAFFRLTWGSTTTRIDDLESWWWADGGGLAMGEECSAAARVAVAGHRK